MTEPVKGTDPQVDSPQRHELNRALRSLAEVRKEIDIAKVAKAALITDEMRQVDKSLKALGIAEEAITLEVRTLGTLVFPNGALKGVFPGIYVVEKTEYKYEEEDALEYSKENFKAAVITKLDDGMFLGMVKGIDPASLQKNMPWVKVIKYPFTMIASNLDEAMPPPEPEPAEKEVTDGVSDARETDPVGQ